MDNFKLGMNSMLVGGLYEFQELRKKQFNRLRQIVFRKREGLDVTQKQEKKEDEEKSWGKEYDDKKICLLMDTMLKEDQLTKEEYDYLTHIKELLDDTRAKEIEYEHLVTNLMEGELIYHKWLKQVKGVGPKITAMLLYFFGYCEKAPHVSSLWKFSGMHVVNGKAPKHTKGEDSNFSPKARMFMYRIGDCFIKQRTIPYRLVYDNEKERLAKVRFEPGILKEKFGGKYKKDSVELTKMHIDLRARRKMMKVFLQHYYVKTKLVTGQVPSEPYVTAKLEGHTHIIQPGERETQIC